MGRADSGERSATTGRASGEQSDAYISAVADFLLLFALTVAVAAAVVVVI